MNKKYAIALIFALLVFGFVINRTDQRNINPTNVLKIENEATPGVAVNVDYPTANNLNEMKNSADYIVEGVFITLTKKWNAARNSQDPLEESTVNHIVANAYDFKVTKVFKGEVDENIIVSLIYSRQLEGMNTPEIDAYFQEPSPEKHVILLLKKDELSGYYYPSIFPYQFEKTTDTTYQVKTNDPSLLEGFKSMEFESNDFVN
jgi:hypothetical protein